MKKRLIFSLIILFIISLILTISIILVCININKEYNYESAKKEAITFLNKNADNIQKLAEELLDEKSNEIRKYKEIEYKYYEEEVYFDTLVGKEQVRFEINAQGMLGGQYWGLIYSRNDDLLNDKIKYVYNENERTGKGNNIFIREKIKDRWYFFYDDWDGKVGEQGYMDQK